LYLLVADYLLMFFNFDSLLLFQSSPVQSSPVQSSPAYSNPAEVAGIHEMLKNIWNTFIYLLQLMYQHSKLQQSLSSASLWEIKNSRSKTVSYELADFTDISAGFLLFFMWVGL